MKKILALLAGLALVMVSFISAANATGQDKVGVCHRTASETNPYVYIEVPASEANGHITGTDSQHNHKVFWPTAGTWRGVAHNAGDERMDYYANNRSECEDSTPVVTPTPDPTQTPTPTPTVIPTPTVTPTETPTGNKPSETPKHHVKVVIPTVVHAGL